MTLDQNSAMPVVLVCGMPRSGTTLLMLMLDSHPHGLMPRGRVLQTTSDDWIHGVSNRRELDQFLDHLYTSDYLHRPPRSSQQDLHAVLQPNLPLTYQSLIQRINFHDATIRPDSDFFWGEKTSELIWKWDILKNNLDNPRLVIVLRDGRAILSSLLKAHSVAGLETNLYQWATDYNNFSKRVAALQNEPNVNVIRYEDLVTQPRPVLQNLSSFLGIQYHPDMLSYTHKAKRFTNDPKRAMHKLIQEDPNAGRGIAWQQELSPHIIRISNHLINESLAMWNYSALPTPLKKSTIRVQLESLQYKIAINLYLVLKYNIPGIRPSRLSLRLEKFIGYRS